MFSIFHDTNICKRTLRSAEEANRENNGSFSKKKVESHMSRYEKMCLSPLGTLDICHCAEGRTFTCPDQSHRRDRRMSTSIPDFATAFQGFVVLDTATDAIICCNFGPSDLLFSAASVHGVRYLVTLSVKYITCQRIRYAWQL